MRPTGRGFSSVEIVAGIAVLGALLAVAVPAFVRNVHSSHLAEATRGLGELQTAGVAYGREHAALPPSAPLTPNPVARGARAPDPVGAWDHPSWKAVNFRPVPDGVAHSFSFVTEQGATQWTARAHGDLDGDGVLSTFEVSVTMAPEGPRADPGMVVEAELE